MQYVRAGKLRAETAADDIKWLRALPLQSTPCRDLASRALAIALARGVSAYDAMYLALAEATDSVLVTADRRLADAADRAELLS